MKLVEVAKVGDYVNYDALIPEEKRCEEIAREHMNWRVLKNDGKNVTIISEKPTKAKISLRGKAGFLEGCNKLDRVADELYSGDIGTARNLKVEDVNELLGYKVDKVSANGKKVPYATNISKLEQKFNKKLKYRSTPDKKDVGEYKQTYYCYPAYESRDSIEYQLMFGRKDTYRYWLSSHCVYANFSNGHADFCMRCVYSVRVGTCDLYVSSGFWHGFVLACRPIITLNSSTIVLNEQAWGKTAKTAWKIK